MVYCNIKHKGGNGKTELKLNYTGTKPNYKTAKMNMKEGRRRYMMVGSRETTQ